MKITNRRNFIKKTALSGVVGITMPYIACSKHEIDRDMLPGDKPDGYGKGEVLYNGIRLPEVWPPRDISKTAYEPMPVPYLSYPPPIIPIDVGRQLFVDDFLIEKTNLKCEFHKAKKYEGNPVLKSETKLEKGSNYLPTAVPKDGGVWWDPTDKVFKMWYEAGWLENTAYATSVDGIHWERPNLDIQPGTNRILPKLIPGNDTFYLDHFANNSDERFKAFFRQEGGLSVSRRSFTNDGYSMVSADGIHWGEPVPSGYLGDKSTVFYNPFRKKWVYSIRSGGRLTSPYGRARYYREHSDFLKGAKWTDDDLVFWTGADYLDLPDPDIGEKAQLYNLAAVGYESIMLGLHEIHLGPPNEECMKQGIPKITELMLSYSRDGFHWYRPDREAFIPATRKPDSWDRGYVQSVGGVCLIAKDQLWFYYTGFRGDKEKIATVAELSGTYANGSTGIATLRRDGFVSMVADGYTGTLTTRPLTFSGKYFFVNVDCPEGMLKVDILNRDHSIISPFNLENCEPVKTDSTFHKVSWKNSIDLSALAGKEIRFRFHLKNGHLYSFWVSPDESGASHGYVAAGGPGYTGAKDDLGVSAYKEAASFVKY